MGRWRLLVDVTTKRCIRKRPKVRWQTRQMQSTRKVDHHKPTSNCIAVKALPKSADMKMDAIAVSRKLFGDCLRRMRPARDVESEGDRVGSTLKETESSSGCGAILH
jgi:hypothetical protein